jgi:hypothetical protein
VALSHVGYHGAAAASVATTNAIGDILVVRAYRTASGTAPDLPASGWNDLGTTAATGGAGSTQTASRAGWRVATATNEGSGTWTNATAVEVLVLRGQRATDPIGAVTATSENATRDYIRYGAATRTEAGSWWAMFGSRLSTGANASVATAPNDGTSSPTNRGSTPGTPYMAAHSGPALGNWSQTDVTIGGTAYKYNSWVIEVRHEPDPPSHVDADGRAEAIFGVESTSVLLAYALAATVQGIAGVTGAPEVVEPFSPYQDAAGRRTSTTRG